MSQNIIATAGEFSSAHFINTHLDQAQFASLTLAYLKNFPETEDKVAFLNEVIRMGRILLDESQFVLKRMEGQTVSVADLSLLN